MANDKLSSAKTAKNDEFYTQYPDIQKEMNALVDYNPNVFRDKCIFLPCDDPEWSNFTKFFAQNFQLLGIRKLISTSYAPESKKYKMPYQPTLFETSKPYFDADKSKTHGKIFILDRDITGDNRIDINDLRWEYLEGDGDFRSKEITQLLKEADIIATNPPFSLFREFIAWLMASGKQFVIIGNMNAVTYKEIFPLIKNNKIWVDNPFVRGAAYFTSPLELNKDLSYFNSHDYREGFIRVPGVRWFTNIELGRRHEPLQLMTMAENIKHSKHKEIRGRKEYIHYENYDAIEVPFTDAIPKDYKGIMGVPKSYLDKYCPEQFEIIGIAEGDSGKELGLKPFPPELKKINPSLRQGQLYYMEDGYPVKPYARLLIRKKE
jgi:hypothetical protein